MARHRLITIPAAQRGAEFVAELRTRDRLVASFVDPDPEGADALLREYLERASRSASDKRVVRGSSTTGEPQ